MKRICSSVVSILTWGMLLASLLYLLCIWKTIPEIIGVHFASDGTFDVFDSKFYIAYPYAVGFGFLFLLELASASCRKASIGMKVNAAGEHRLRVFLAVLLNGLKLFVSVFFTHWSWCVMVQKSQNLLFLRISIYTVLIMFLIFLCSIVFIRLQYPLKPEQEVQHEQKLS